MDLSLKDLLLDFFSKVVKVDGSSYPSASIMNLLNGFNRILRRASDVKSLKGLGNLMDKNFNIISHFAFAKTRMVVNAIVKKSSYDNVKKK